MSSVGGEINCFFWIERLFLFLLVIFPTHLLDLIVAIIFFTSVFTIFFFFACPNLSSVGPSGIGGIWLFLLDRSTFYLAFEYFKLLAGGFDLAFLWRLTVFVSILVHSIYIVEHLLRSHQTVPPPPSPPQPQNDETRGGEGDVCKEVENMKELVEDGKKLISFMDHMIISGLETQRKEWLVFLDELNKDGKKMMMTKLDGMICSQLETLRDSMRLNADEICQELRDELRSKVDEHNKASRQEFNKDVKSVADQLSETYLIIQETVKDANLIGHKKRQVIRGEDVEGFVELREQVKRIAVEAEVAVVKLREQVQRMAMEAEITAEELSRATVELVEAAGIQQWEEDNADYLASLPHLYR